MESALGWESLGGWQAPLRSEESLGKRNESFGETFGEQRELGG